MLAPSKSPRKASRVLSNPSTTGFFDYFPRMAEFYAEMGPWVANGTVKSKETVVNGLDNTLDAFLGLFVGANTGKMLVKL